MEVRARNVSLQHWDKSAAELSPLEVSEALPFMPCSGDPRPCMMHKDICCGPQGYDSLMVVSSLMPIVLESVALGYCLSAVSAT